MDSPLSVKRTKLVSKRGLLCWSLIVLEGYVLCAGSSGTSGGNQAHSRPVGLECLSGNAGGLAWKSPARRSRSRSRSPRRHRRRSLSPSSSSSSEGSLSSSQSRSPRKRSLSPPPKDRVERWAHPPQTHTSARTSSSYACTHARAHTQAHGQAVLPTESMGSHSCRLNSCTNCDKVKPPPPLPCSGCSLVVKRWCFWPQAISKEEGRRT
jgi:hypothetical protein